MALTRRDWFRLSLGAAGVSASGWLRALADDAASHPQRKRACILLWLNGGPSTIDLWDLKPGHANGGPFKERATSSPDLRISEHLPKIAEWGKHLAVIRSMSTKEGDHGQASYLMRTGMRPQGAIEFPTIGSLVAKELGKDGADLPPFVSVAPQRNLSQSAYGPGFLGPRYGPLIVGENAGPANGAAADQALKVQDIAPPDGVGKAQADKRLELLNDLDTEFVRGRSDGATKSHRAAVEGAVRLMRPEAAKAFDLTGEPAKLRDSYGRNLFGQGCLLARRLVEKGVPFVEVNLDGWDTHSDNFEAVKRQCGVLDPAWAALMADLKDRGMLDSTTIICMGEFGRTPKIVADRNGRDHFPNAWSVVLAGGGIKGGQAIGKTDKGGDAVLERPTATPDVLATLCMALGIDPARTNMSNVGRPIRIVDKTANPIEEIVA
jgi:hypothetical protein